MAQQAQPTPLAKAGFAIAAAAFLVMVALGFSGQTVVSTIPAPGSLSSTVGCGSVFSPEVQPLCDETLADRKNLMMVVGIPGVVLGLGIVVAASRHSKRQTGR